MKTQYLITAVLSLGFVASLPAQTMRWIPSQSISRAGSCVDESSKSGLTECYVLEYTPAASGVLTSYTTGFLVSCTSLGSAISKNQGCSMTAKNNETNGCSIIGKVLLNSSGNSGTITNNKIEAGVPVILHQVCLTIPSGESVSIEEEPVTDLSTSIDVGDGSYLTEYPAYETSVFKRIRFDAARPVALLDFQAARNGDKSSRLDWTHLGETKVASFVIERSGNGAVFEPIGEVKGVSESAAINSYQFIDEHAVTGSNYYRLRQQDIAGVVTVSPVRELYFTDKPMAVTASPNPAIDKLYVDIAHAAMPGDVVIFDVSGKQRITLDFDLSHTSVVLDLQSLAPGLYTLQVKSGKETHVEKIAVIR
jgi:hypothetical protein